MKAKLAEAKEAHPVSGNGRTTAHCVCRKTETIVIAVGLGAQGAFQEGRRVVEGRAREPQEQKVISLNSIQSSLCVNRFRQQISHSVLE